MQNWKKIILLLVVLAPSIFFVSQAFSGNSAKINGDQLEISGPGGLNIFLSDIENLEMVDKLPETSGTGGFALGLIKKGNFIRSSDQEEIRLIKNGDGPYIHLTSKRGELYFDLESYTETEKIYEELLAKKP